MTYLSLSSSYDIGVLGRYEALLMVKIIGLSSFLCSSDMSGASSLSCINMSSIPGTGVFSRLVTVFIPTNQKRISMGLSIK